MVARDAFHNAVKHGLIKDGWTITHDPLVLRFYGKNLYADLGAEKFIGAEKSNQKIAVEVKSFTGNSEITEFYGALGQLLHYRVILDEKEPERKLYLAVPEDAHIGLFNLALVQAVVKRYEVPMLVYDPTKEVISQWLE
jgi:XisH protein